MRASLPLLLVLLSFCYLHVASSFHVGVPFLPSKQPETWDTKPYSGPSTAPSSASTCQGPIVTYRHKGHPRNHQHHQPKTPYIFSPTSAVAPDNSAARGCGQTCLEPFTSTPIGSPCGCVLPIKVRLVLSIAVYALFQEVNELEIEVAAGTYLKHSQVQIVGATADSQNQGSAVVDINLVPLGEKFDNTTATLIYERFLRTEVPLNRTLFGYYKMSDIYYPGITDLPSGGYIANGPFGSNEDHQQPITANVLDRNSRMNPKIVFIIVFSALVLLLACLAAISILIRFKKVRKLSVGPDYKPAISKKSGTDGVNKPLDWDARIKIALGAARGLAYLHEDSNPRVIHRDFKASNVLLEDDFTPKVSDFGLAREATEGSHHNSTRVMGTFGYVAPEYAMTGHLLVKSDVYSYGVVLLELLTGRKPVDMSQPPGQENLVTWARSLWTTREGLEELVDPNLAGTYKFDDMAKVASIASMCVHPEVIQRPFMGEVVQALKLSNDTDETCADAGSPKDSLIHYLDSRSDVGPSDSSWWNAGALSPCLTYGQASSFMTMDYSSDPLDDMENKPFSTSCLAAERVALPIWHGNRSGPLRTIRSKRSFYRLNALLLPIKGQYE